MKKQSAIEKARRFVADRQLPSRRFYAKWPQQLIQSVHEVREAWRDGQIPGSARAIAEFIRQECKNSNVSVPSMSVLEKWLNLRD